MNTSTLIIVFVIIAAALLVWVLSPLIKLKLGFTPSGPYDNAIVSGSARGISSDDIAAAIAADVAVPHQDRRDKLCEIEIVAPDEIHLFWDFRKSESVSYEVVKRVAGKWQYITQASATSSSNPI